MPTWLRLLGIVATCAGLFALTWHFAGREARERNQPPPPKAKTTAELLIGTWEIVEQDPPIPPVIKATSEYTADGKTILRVTDLRGPLPPTVRVYQLNGDTIRIDSPQEDNEPYHSWVARIETITDDTLVLTSEGITKRVVSKRVSGN